MKEQHPDDVSINTIRFLAVDAVQKANSGHPGLPMGAAAMAYVLWTRFLRHNPADPHWPDRDRFVLSAGHGSMLLYALLHLTGYDLPMEEIKRFRQWGSRTPGHPESHMTAGVEATTGPLGQGISNAVGMAMAEAHLAARFNRPGHTIVDHYTYVIASDGDLMEGVAAEACSLAGHLGLGKLIVLYDSNAVTLSGTTSLTSPRTWARDSRVRMARARVDDGNDLAAVDKALEGARQVGDRPSLIIARTILGYGAPHKQGTFARARQSAGAGRGEGREGSARLAAWSPRSSCRTSRASNFARRASGARAGSRSGTVAFAAYADGISRARGRDSRDGCGAICRPAGTPACRRSPPTPKGVATRKASEAVMQALAPKLPELVGGSADLNPSTFTWLKQQGDFEAPTRSEDGVQGAVGGGWGYPARNFHFGVREHAMGAAVNGMLYHGGLHRRTARRSSSSPTTCGPRFASPRWLVSAVVWVYTHDSIGLGEDGPTHQPVEHHLALRAIPGPAVHPARRRERDGVGVAESPSSTATARPSWRSLGRTSRLSIEASTRRPKA